MALVSDILFGQFALQQGWVSQDVLQGCLGEQSQLIAHGQACGLADLMAHRGVINTQNARQLVQQISALSFRCQSCASAWTYEQVANQEGFACLYCRNALDIQQAPPSGVMQDPSVRPVQNSHFILADSDSGSRIAYANRPRSGPHQAPNPSGQAPGPGGTQIIYSSNRQNDTVKKGTRFDSETFKSMGSKGKIVGSSGLLRNIDGRKFIGDFEVSDELGRGAMGVVYKVRNPNNGQLVALKLLLAGGLASETQIQRFVREAEITARLEHPVIVPIHDFGSIEGHPFFTMQFIEGKPLSTLIKRRKLGIRKSVMIARELARGLHYAHSQKVVHRDIKPANILIDSDLRPHLTDFGLARDIDEDEKQRLTRSGAVIGTPYYMAPEQVEGSKDLGPPCDVYALGVVLYQMLTFHLPFKAKSQIELSRMILKDMPARPSSIESGVDKKLDAITLKALAKKPDHRYASAADMAADLDAYLAGESVMARSRGARNNLPKFLGITVAMLALVATGVFATILVLGPRKNITIPNNGGTKPGTGKTPKIGPKPGERLKAASAIKRAKEKIHEARISSDPELFSPLLKEAVTDLTLAISLDESLSEALILRGVARALLSETERARIDLKAAGNDPMALFYLSRVTKDGEEGEDEKADKAFADVIHLMSQASRLPNDSVFVHLAKAFIVAFKNKEPNIALEMLAPLVTRYPDFTADIYLLKGYFQLSLKRDDEALVSFNRVLRIYPNSQSALNNRCQLLMRLKDFAAALRDSERLSKLDPDTATAYAIQGQIHAAKNEMPQAIRKFRRYLDLKPEDHQARLLYARWLSNENKVSEAVIQAQRAIKQAPQNPSGYRLLARIYRSHSRTLEGDEVTKRAIKTIKKPELQWELFSDLITEWVKRKRIDAAERACRARMRSHPHEALAYILLGQAYFITGKEDAGLELLEEGMKIEPENLKACQSFLEGLAQLGRHTQATEVVKTMLARLPGNANALILAADAALRTGEIRRASGYIKQALASEPGNAKAKLRLTSMCLARLEHNEVERLVGELVANDKTPKDILSEARTMLASSYAQRNRLSLAVEEASKAMQIDRTNPSPRGMLAKLLFNAKRFKQAYELCKNSTKQNIVNVDIVDILGRIELFQNRNLKEAERAFKFVLANRKNDPVSYYFYALTLKRMGETDAARTFIDRGLQLDPSHEMLLKLKGSLKKP